MAGMELTQRDRTIYLSRLSGRDVKEIACDHGLSRAQVHRIIARIRDSGGVTARVGVSADTVSGPLTPSEIAEAIRDYARSLGVQPPPIEKVGKKS